MRGLWGVMLALSACGGSTDPGPVTCEPNDPNPDCEIYDCHGAMACDATCQMDTPCGKLDCSDAAQCRMDCQMREQCEVDCRGAQTCFVDCEEDSTCHADCTGAGCSLHCHPRAQCELDCGDSTDCRITACDGGTATQCPNGVVVCNRPCP